jgi:DnaD/phage-associated family protein
MAEGDLLIPAQELRRLLASGCGDAALVYLYLHTGGDPAAACQTLRLSPRQYEFAAATLRQLSLVPEPAPRRLESAEAPAYTEEDLTREYKTNPEFPSMVGEAQRRLGRVLSTEELKILLSIYRYLGLPPEVVSILINYCIQRSHARGSSRLPSIRTIEKEAYHWADLGVDTMEEAAVYMQNQLQLQTRAGRIRQVLQLGERPFTAAEEKFVLTWLGWGFGEAEVQLAYEKTCLNTGALKWPYLNSILKSWHDQGLLTVAQIQRGDRAPAAQPAGRANRAVQTHHDALTPLEQDAIDKMMRRGKYKEE